MRVGLVSPIVSLNPRSHNVWELDASPEDLVAVAQAADRLGWHHLTASEHVGIPAAEAARRGARYWDPVVTLSWLAGQTAQIKLATHVLVVGYHHPVELAKTWGTVERVAPGRAILGLGVGSLEEEFTLLGKEFSGRGALADQALRELRAAMGQDVVQGFVIDPPLPRVPVWIGGRSQRSLDRALALGDGWAPFGLSAAEISELLPSDRPEGFEVVLNPPLGWDVLGDPDGCRRQLEEWTTAGATILNLRLVHTSLAHCLEQLEATIGLVA